MNELRQSQYKAPSVWTANAIFYGLALFALAIPHSIAVAQTGFTLAVLLWLLSSMRSLRSPFDRTPLDFPLLAFSGLTILSALFSVERFISLPKLRTLTLFALIYVVIRCVSVKRARLLVLMVIISGLVGVVFSLGEKVVGRGMIVTAVSAQSPLLASGLQPGDAIWMVARHRVSSISEIAEIVRSQPAGKKVDFEALHAGDPLPVELTITNELKEHPELLGLKGEGRTRRFRVSGFTRHFLTYAEQMQLFALLLLGLLVVSLREKSIQWNRLALYGTGFALFSLALLLTATRGVIVSFLLTFVVIALLAGGKRMAWLALPLVLLMVTAGFWFLSSIRTQGAVRLTDDSTQRRIEYMKAGLKMIPRYPLLGTGMDSLRMHWHEWNFPGDYITHTHSTPIQIALERGLPALICYFWLTAAMALILWRQFVRAREITDRFATGVALGSLGGVIGFLLSSLTNYNFGDSETLLLLLLFVALSLVVNSEPRLPASASESE